MADQISPYSGMAAYRGPVGEFNPWLYMSEEDRLAAERAMLERGGPNAYGALGRGDPRVPLPYDPVGHSQGQFDRWLADKQESALGMGPTVGAAAATALDFIPGPGESFPFMPGALGMAGGKKVSSLLDRMSPSARERAEDAAFGVGKKADGTKRFKDAAEEKKYNRLMKLSPDERIDQIDDEFWNDEFMGGLGENIWEDWNFDEIPTRGDELERTAREIRDNWDLEDKLGDEIRKHIPNEWNPDDFYEALPGELIDEIYRDWPEHYDEIRRTGKLHEDVHHLVDEWSKEKAEKLIEKKAKEYDPVLEDWDEDLMDWRSEDHDFEWADYGQERPVGERTRRREFDQMFKDEITDLSFAVGSDYEKKISQEIFDEFYEPYRDRNLKEWFEQWTDKLDGEEIFKELPQDTAEWTQETMSQVLKKLHDRKQPKLEDVEYHLGGRVGDDRAKDVLSKPKTQSVINEFLKGLKEIRDQAIDKALEHEDLSGLIDDMKYYAKREHGVKSKSSIKKIDDLKDKLSDVEAKERRAKFKVVKDDD